MNIIQIAEQLKDVPDQYLANEVQNPTGAYPAYLVISELTRRKRMRDAVQKQEPTTTVAQDLTQQAAPAGIPAAAAMTAPQQAQAAPAEMPAMAGGGLVAFKQGGDVVRAFDGLPEEMFSGSYEPPVKKYPDEIEAYRPGTFSTLFGLMPEGIGSGNIDYELGKLGYPKSDISSMDPAMKRYIVSKVKEGEKSQTAIQKQTPNQGQQFQLKQEQKTEEKAKPFEIRIPSPAKIADPFATERTTTVRDILGTQYKTPEQLDVERQKGMSRYESEIPFRLGFLEEEIAKRGKDIEGRRDTNINEALMQAGLKIMGSKSPRLLQAVSEGGLSGLEAYRQGKKDIQSAEDALTQSKVAYANAQTLYDQGKFSAGDKALDRAQSDEARALALKNSKYSIFKNEMDSARQDAIAGAQIPYFQAGAAKSLAEAEFTKNYRGRSADITPSPAEIKSAYDLADQKISQMIMEKGSTLKIGSPEAARMRDQIAQQILMQSGKSYMPPTVGGMGGNLGGFSYQVNK